jgi:hypothetical protein
MTPWKEPYGSSVRLAGLLLAGFSDVDARASAAASVALRPRKLTNSSFFNPVRVLAQAKDDRMSI